MVGERSKKWKVKIRGSGQVAQYYRKSEEERVNGTSGL